MSSTTLSALTWLMAGLISTGLLLIWVSYWPSSRQRRIPARNLLHRRLDQGGGINSPVTFLLLSVGSGLLSAFIAALTYALPLLIFAAALVGSFLPWLWLGARIRAKEAEMRAAWPDAIDHISSAIRAGLPLPDALSLLGQSGPDKLRPFFHEFHASYEASGDFDMSLSRLQKAFRDPHADQLIEVIRLARQVGGADIGALLRTLAQFFREDNALRSEMQARASWTVNAARLALVAPWAMLALLGIQGSSLQAYNSTAGSIVLIGGAAISGLAYLVMRHIGSLPETPRVLR